MGFERNFNFIILLLREFTLSFMTQNLHYVKWWIFDIVWIFKRYKNENQQLKHW